jgi:hypothetical protein
MLLLATYHQRGRLQSHVLYVPAMLSVLLVCRADILRTGPYLLLEIYQIRQRLAGTGSRSKGERIGGMEMVDWTISVA